MAAAPGPGPAIACAACKYQRRRCTPDCPLAAYFPHDRPRVFRNAHRLFGVSNILKTLKTAGPIKRDEAMRSIIVESQAWDVYPAAGCVPVILELDRRVRQAQLQLRQVQEAIEAYKSHYPRHHSTGGDEDDGGITSGSCDGLALEKQMMMMSMALPPPLQYEDGGMMELHNINETEMGYLLLVDAAAANEMQQMPYYDCTSSADCLEKNMLKAPSIFDDCGTNNGFKQDDDDAAAPMAGGGGACFTTTLAGGADQS